MLFDKTADFRLQLTFWATLIMGAVLSIYLAFVGYSHVVRLGNELNTFWLSPQFLVLAVAAIVFFVVAYLTTTTKYMDRYRAKELIEMMMVVFEDRYDGDNSMLFPGVDGVLVTVSKRPNGAFTVIVETPRGIERQLVVQRYRITCDENPAELLPISELRYIRALVALINGEVGFASLLGRSDLEWEKMVNRSEAELA